MFEWCGWVCVSCVWSWWLLYVVWVGEAVVVCFSWVCVVCVGCVWCVCGVCVVCVVCVWCVCVVCVWCVWCVCGVCGVCVCLGELVEPGSVLVQASWLSGGLLWVEAKAWSSAVVDKALATRP